jgi:hypothetical protein
LLEIAEEFATPFLDFGGPAYKLGQSPFAGDQLAKMGYRAQAGIYSAAISDTVLLMRRPDWESGNAKIANAEAVIWLAQFVCKMMKINSVYGIPLRGAISFGECIISIKGRPSLLGSPTGEASWWEKQQEWIGGMLAPSAVEALRNGAEAARKINGPDFSPEYPDFLVRYPIPLKADVILSGPHIALNWITSLIPGTMLFMASPPSTPDSNASDAVKRKVQNTLAFAEHCRSGETGTGSRIVWD